MDILKKYEEKYPQMSSQVPQWELSYEYGLLTRLVIRLSGGMIQDERQANTVLLAISAILIILFLIILFTSGSKRPSISPNDFLLTPPPSSITGIPQ